MATHSFTLVDIIVQHLEEAAILLGRRVRDINSSLQILDSVAKMDRRIDAHLDGLLVDPESAWELCDTNVEFEDAGEVFVSALVALACQESTRFAKIVEIACADANLMDGLVMALGWVPYPQVAATLQPMLAGDSAEQRHAAVAAHSEHRVGGDWLRAALVDPSPLVQACACRAAGEMGRVDLISSLRQQNQSDEPSIVFWSCWSAALLGDLGAVAALRNLVSVPTVSEHVLEIVLRRLAPNAAESWLEELARDENNVRLVVQGSAIVGDPAFVPGLLGMMSIKELARIAAESFCAITGANLTDDNLEVPAPPSDEDDDALDPDDFLPWPDPQRVMAWWQRNETCFKPGTRYLMGKPVSSEQLEWVLRYGNQKLRRGAAIELAMLRPGQPIFNTGAPGRRQQQLLGLK